MCIPSSSLQLMITLSEFHVLILASSRLHFLTILKRCSLSTDDLSYFTCQLLGIFWNTCLSWHTQRTKFSNRTYSDSWVGRLCFNAFDEFDECVLRFCVCVFFDLCFVMFFTMFSFVFIYVFCLFCLFRRCFPWHPYCCRAREVTVSFRTR